MINDCQTYILKIVKVKAAMCEIDSKRIISFVIIRYIYIFDIFVSKYLKKKKRQSCNIRINNDIYMKFSVFEILSEREGLAPCRART